MIITDQMMDRVAELHKKDGEMKMCASLPGDTYENITYSFNCTPICATLMRFPEYQANITYNGNAYERRAFAFGGMTLMGDQIKNPLNAQDVTKKKMDDANSYIKAKKSETDKAINAKKVETDKAIKEKQDETSATIQDRTNAIDTKVWNKTKLVSFLSIALLLISTVVSAFLRFLVPVIALFACAIVGLIISKIFYKKMRDAIEKDTETKNSADISAQEEYINALKTEYKEYTDKLNAKCAAECKAHMDNTILECENYEKTRRSDILAALNAKFASLGMPPASVTEYSI